MNLYCDYLDSPVGKLRLTSNGVSLLKIDFLSTLNEEIAFQRTCSVLDLARIELIEYFTGHRKSFDVPLEPNGTPFQQKVWNILMKVDFGKLKTYKDLAIELGDIKKIRAVGTANGANPIPIIIPCHRIIGSNNNLIGYRGGLEIKRWLLQNESAGLDGSLFENQ